MTIPNSDQPEDVSDTSFILMRIEVLCYTSLQPFFTIALNVVFQCSVLWSLLSFTHPDRDLLLVESLSFPPSQVFNHHEVSRTLKTCLQKCSLNLKSLEPSRPTFRSFWREMHGWLSSVQNAVSLFCASGFVKRRRGVEVTYCCIYLKTTLLHLAYVLQ